MEKCMVSEQNIILKNYLKAVLEFVILPIPPAFFNGEINQWAVTLSEKQRILFTFFADKINNTKSIEIALENKDIDNSYIPITEIGHKFSESVSVTDAVSHCLDDFCKKL